MLDKIWFAKKWNYMKERTSTAMLKKGKSGYVTDKTFLGSFWIYVLRAILLGNSSGNPV